eukprot:7385006-Prymnesium_polylepis.1
MVATKQQAPSVTVAGTIGDGESGGDGDAVAAGNSEDDITGMGMSCDGTCPSASWIGSTDVACIYVAADESST